MNKQINFIFWGVIFLMLVALFSGSLNSWMLSFYFVSFLLPVVIGTSLYFSEVLVPRFLMTERLGQFVLRFFYLLVISIYGEMLVIMIAFVMIADYNIDNLGTYAGDIRLLAVIMYLIVFGHGFVMAFGKLKSREERLSALLRENEQEKTSNITLTINRQKVPVSVDKIQFIESLSDYVKIHLDDAVLITRERISSLEEELPKNFVRIHRSFLVNKKEVSSFSSEQVAVNNHTLSIGRKFKKDAIESLSA